MSVAAKANRIKWDEGKADELWAFVQEETAKGRKVTTALREFAAQNGISWLTARWKYYRVKNERDVVTPDQESVAEEKVGTPPRKDALLEHLTGFMRHAQSCELDLQELFAGLHQLTRQAAASTTLKTELKQYEDRFERQQQQCEELKARLEQVREQYQTLNYLTNDWLNLQSVDKVTSMGDFGRKLKYEVDRFGTVIKVEG